MLPKLRVKSAKISPKILLVHTPVSRSNLSYNLSTKKASRQIRSLEAKSETTSTCEMVDSIWVKSLKHLLEIRVTQETLILCRNYLRQRKVLKDTHNVTSNTQRTLRTITEIRSFSRLSFTDIGIKFCELL